MAREVLGKESLSEIFQAMPHILHLPVAKMWMDYDREGDVLCISFKRPQRATESEMLENGVLLRYKDNELVGVTVLHASKR
jgi:uncharacterized protein YuzE